MHQFNESISDILNAQIHSQNILTVIVAWFGLLIAALLTYK